MTTAHTYRLDLIYPDTGHRLCYTGLALTEAEELLKRAAMDDQVVFETIVGVET